VSDSPGVSPLDAIEQWFKNTVAFLLRLFFRSTPRGELSFDEVKNVLVVRQHDQLGDMLCAIPLLRALRERFPAAHTILVSSPVNYEIMRNQPFTDDVLNYDKERFLRSPLLFFQFVRALRSREYDLAVVPTTVSVSLTSNIIAFASGARVRLGPESLAGRANPTAFLFNVRVPLGWENDVHRHQTFRNLDTAASLGIGTENLEIVLGITESERAEGQQFLASFRREHKILVGFHPGAGKVANRLAARRFAEVANTLHDRFGIGAIVTAGPMDDGPVNAMLQSVRSPFLLIRNKPIRSVAAIVGELNLFITNDTGIMHVAAGTSAPTLSLFGPTDPLQWAPRGQKNRYIRSEGNDIQGITTAQIVEVAAQMLSLA